MAGRRAQGERRLGSSRWEVTASSTAFLPAWQRSGTRVPSPGSRALVPTPNAFIPSTLQHNRAPPAWPSVQRKPTVRASSSLPLIAATVYGPPPSHRSSQLRCFRRAARARGCLRSGLHLFCSVSPSAEDVGTGAVGVPAGSRTLQQPPHLSSALKALIKQFW